MLIALGYFLLLSLIITLLLLATELRKTKELLGYANTDLQEARIRESVTNRQVGEVFLHISPLLEQTDWMTGRWGGQFETLVRMENRRNAATVGIKKILLGLPYLKNYISENKVALHMGSTQDALTGIENAYR